MLQFVALLFLSALTLAAGLECTDPAKPLNIPKNYQAVTQNTEYLCWTEDHGRIGYSSDNNANYLVSNCADECTGSPEMSFFKNGPFVRCYCFDEYSKCETPAGPYTYFTRYVRNDETCGACPGATPEWDNDSAQCKAANCAADEFWEQTSLTEGHCEPCPAATPKSLLNECGACPGATPEWDGTACVVAANCAADEFWEQTSLAEGHCVGCPAATPKSLLNECVSAEQHFCSAVDGAAAFLDECGNCVGQIGFDIDGEAAGDESGHSVSLSEDGRIMAVGAYKHDGEKGHVRIYQRPAVTGWALIGDIGGEVDGDKAGYSVSLSADGTKMAIAVIKDYDHTRRSCVRVYQRDESVALGWRQLGLDIDDTITRDHDTVGYSVSLSPDGSVVAIGNPNHREEWLINMGHVRVYQWDDSGGSDSPSWKQLGGDIVGEGNYDYTGHSISLSYDGTIVAIGAPEHDDDGVAPLAGNGHVRVFQRDESVDLGWKQIGSKIEGDTLKDKMGSSVSLSADGAILAVGAPQNRANNKFRAGHARVYQRDENVNLGWKQVGEDIEGEAAWDYSGSSVSLSADGSAVAIGAVYNRANLRQAGHVRVYQRDENVDLGWKQVGEDIDGEAKLDYSGYSVSLSADGSTVAIGAWGNDDGGDNSGHVRAYSLPPGLCCHGDTPYEDSSTCVASCPAEKPKLDGSTCVASCPADKPKLDGSACVASCPADKPKLDGSTCAPCSGVSKWDGAQCTDAYIKTNLQRLADMRCSGGTGFDADAAATAFAELQQPCSTE